MKPSGAQVKCPCGHRFEIPAERREMKTPCPACKRMISPARPVSVTIPGFRIERKIGAGGMGQVYLAVQENIGRQVALKILPAEFSRRPESVKRFQSEARLVGKLRHENIVSALDCGEAGGRHYLVMEYVEGETLHARVRRDGPLEEGEALRIGRQVAAGLSYAHRKGMIHRDVKASNVILRPDGTAKICDFGLALEITSDVRLTQEGFTFSSPAYASPEQGKGIRELDHRTDMYSLGVTLFEALTGRLPFPGDTAQAVLMKHVTETPPSPRGINTSLSPAANKLVLRLLRKSPEGRFASHDDLIAAIDEAMAPTAPVTRRRTTAPPVASGRSVVPWIAGVATAAAVLVLFLLVRGGGEDDPAPREVVGERPSATRSKPKEPPEVSALRKAQDLLTRADAEVQAGRHAEAIRILGEFPFELEETDEGKRIASRTRAVAVELTERWKAACELSRKTIEGGDFDEARRTIAALQAMGSVRTKEGTQYSRAEFVADVSGLERQLSDAERLAKVPEPPRVPAPSPPSEPKQALPVPPPPSPVDRPEPTLPPEDPASPPPRGVPGGRSVPRPRGRPRPRAPAVHFTFEEGTFADLRNGAARVDGSVGKAVLLDGVDDYVNGPVEGLPAANRPQTIAWMYRVERNPGGVQTIISLSNDPQMSGVQPGFRKGFLAVWRAKGVILVGTDPPAAGAWHAVAYTFDGTTHRLYVDGREVDVSSKTPQTAAPSALDLGRWTGGTEYFKGALDEVRIYSRALSPDEVRGLVPSDLVDASLPPKDPAPPQPADAVGTKLAVPDAKAQRKALSVVRDALKEDYGRKTRYQRFQLAKKLFELGRKESEQPDRQYVLLRESMDVAAGLGEIKGALLALREIDLLFDVDKDEIRWGVLTVATRNAASESQLREVASAYHSLAEDARDRDDFTLAQRAAGAASSAARKASDRTLAARSSDFVRDVNAIRKELPAVRRALDALKRGGDDPKLNLVVGRHECITRGRWDRGLPYLAKGSHEGMKAAAVRDLARPTGFKDRVEVGDAWWDLSEKMTGKTKQGLSGRAAGWYQLALPDVTELEAIRLKRRITSVPKEKVSVLGARKTVAPAPVPGAPAAASAGPWRAIVDGKSLDGLKQNNAWQAYNGAIVRVPGQKSACQSREAFGDADVRIRFEVERSGTVYFKVRQGPEGHYEVRWNRAQLSTLEGKVLELIFICRGDSVTATLDGSPLSVTNSGTPRRGGIQFNAPQGGDGLRLLSIAVRAPGR